ncbi:MAG: alanine:cation symporter family protein [Eubacterium sp.]|nr:alanine:cation symporter family protein [Eubacterium sp.]
MNHFNSILGKIDDFVWGIPLICAILAVGLLLTIRLKGLQFRKLGLGFKYAFAKDKSENKQGDVSAFQALCTALSATIGTGNIVGVATAIAAGGPGALFWMWIAALVGTATKFAECMLAVKYRSTAEDGHIIGGPFYYIEKGMGKNFKFLAYLFAIFGVLVGLLGIGTFTQINGITSAIKNFFDPDTKNVAFNIFNTDYSWSTVIAGLILTAIVALVLIGGIKRISAVAEKVVPFMAIIYIVISLMVLLTHIPAIPAAFANIIESAFGLRAVSGGALGATLLAMQKGIARGIFSNEAGLGSAPIAAAAAKTDEPVHQGLISMLGTFIDTIIICTMTGLTIVIMQSKAPEAFAGLEGVQITSKAFCLGLPFPEEISAFFLMICLVFFAFTTILGWDYYSEKCLEYILPKKKNVIKIYRGIYILCIFIGPYMTVSAVWTIADIVNGLMAVPNLIALVALSGVVTAEVNSYFTRLKKAKEN